MHWGSTYVKPLHLPLLLSTGSSTLLLWYHFTHLQKTCSNTATFLQTRAETGSWWPSLSSVKAVSAPCPLKTTQRTRCLARFQSRSCSGNLSSCPLGTEISHIWKVLLQQTFYRLKMGLSSGFVVVFLMVWSDQTNLMFPLTAVDLGSLVRTAADISADGGFVASVLCRFYLSL